MSRMNKDTNKKEERKKRSPICTIMGHVDHGKSSILDRIRGTAIAENEAGGITQAIGTSMIPREVLVKVCSEFFSKLGQEIKIPGIVFIDTPGHEAFTNLRKRGGNLADIAILVVDVTEGFKPQTVESIDILRAYKIPFIVAANKIDKITGENFKPDNLLKGLASLDERTRNLIDTKIYELVAQLYDNGFNAERFDRVNDFTKQIAIVPVSARTGAGITEMLAVLIGLAQRFLDENLLYSVSGKAAGTIIEVKEEKGLGKTLNVVIYDGVIRKGDTLVIGNIGEPIITKVRGLFLPAPLSEMRDKKTRFKSVEKVIAATGVKIFAPLPNNVISGMPVRVADNDNIERVKREINEDVDDVIINTDEMGVVARADSLGSLEALISILKKGGIPIRKALIGEITKKDIIDAESNYKNNPLLAVIFAFNVGVSEELLNSSDRVKIIQGDVIYKLIEEYERWVEEEKKKEEKSRLKNINRPFKIKILKGYVFRQKDPAIVGVEVMGGILKVGITLMKNRKKVGIIRGIQAEKESLSEAKKDSEVAVSIDGPIVGRQIKEGDILYSYLSEREFRALKNIKDLLAGDEIEVLKEIAEIMREENAIWGI